MECDICYFPYLIRAVDLDLYRMQHIPFLKTIYLCLKKGLFRRTWPQKFDFLARCKRGKFTPSVVFMHLNAEKEIGVSLLES